MNLRESRIQGEYCRKCAKADRAGGTSKGELGPCEAHLSSFGRVIGLVVGAFGEWSEGLIATFDAIATLAAEKRWREMGARDKVEARGMILAQMRSRAGMMMSVAVARLLIDKTAKILELSDPGLMARKRRQAEHDKLAELARQQRASLGGHLGCDGRRQGFGNLART